MADKPWGKGFQRHEVKVNLADRKRDPVDHPRPIVRPGKGNLYQSTLVDNPLMHAPTLDIDVPCYLVESTTPGHFHLYIDVAMRWEQYAQLLVAMRKAGILNAGYVDLSLQRGATHLRKPEVHKEPEDTPDS